MDIRNLVRLSVVAFGMFLLLDALNSSSFILADGRYYTDGHPYAIASIGVIGAIIMSVVLYVYSEKMHVDGSSVSAITLFRAALKLFGVYVFLKAIPLLIGGLVATFVPVPESSMLAVSARPLALGFIYAVIGYLLSFRTEWVITKLNA